MNIADDLKKSAEKALLTGVDDQKMDEIKEIFAEMQAVVNEMHKLLS